MAITLKPEHEQLIKAQMIAGKYSDSDEVISTALRLLEKCNLEYTQWVTDVRTNVTIARAEVARDEVLDGETLVNSILEKFRQAKEAQKS
jgi:antitoxin ParD1/3/4